ncbi:hypothetical protein [Umezawaea sp. NPDC059074]|uniref:hypothetical protein n=1 Tax=Umezawaea sp. NPDC059074 TaxID=3346716 RepID=UPI0036A83E08
MRDLDALRSALHGSPEREPGSIDIAAVMASGRRIRTRRRVLTGGGVVTGTAALLVAVFVLPQVLAPAAVPEQPSITITAASEPDPTSVPAGGVVMTGYDNQVLYFVAGYRQPVYPSRADATVAPKDRKVTVDGTGYGLTLGTRGLGQVTPLQTTGAAGHWEGFHSVTTRDEGPVQLYGYYEGPVRKILLELNDREIVAARTEKWSADGNITIFWFGPGEFVPGAQDSFRLNAYDADGQLLPY